MEVEVSKSEKGEIFVLAEDGFIASFKNGLWSDECLFDQYQMRDQFSIHNQAESQRIYLEGAKGPQSRFGDCLTTSILSAILAMLAHKSFFYTDIDRCKLVLVTVCCPHLRMDTKIVNKRRLFKSPMYDS